jgi:cytochrome P450
MMIVFVSETLRKYPPVAILTRECTKVYEIPGTDVVLEKGIQVVIPTMGMLYDPQYFPDPEKFDPERFNEEAKSKRHHYTYLPFGEGPRICIGKQTFSANILHFLTVLCVFCTRYIKLTLNTEAVSGRPVVYLREDGCLLGCCTV